MLTPGMGWFLYLFLIPFWAMFPMVIVGDHGALILLIIYLGGFPLAKWAFACSTWYQKAKQHLKTKGHATLGGFSRSAAEVRAVRAGVRVPAAASPGRRQLGRQWQFGKLVDESPERYPMLECYPVFFNFSRKSLRNLATFGATTN
jgi:hypothetical protein